MTLGERFWSKVDQSEGLHGCWLWTAAIDVTGYGRFRMGDLRGMAHRFAYQERGGVIPPGFQIDHLCRVRHCVNPAHLEAVSLRENLLRGAGFPAVNLAKTHCPKGHPYDRANTYVGTRRRGGRFGFTRHCRACDRERGRSKRARAALSQEEAPRHAT